MSIDETLFIETASNKMSFDKMSFDKMSFNKMSFDKMSFDKMSFDEMLFDETSQGLKYVGVIGLRVKPLASEKSVTFNPIRRNFWRRFDCRQRQLKEGEKGIK
jgi:hypothetical protein